MTLEEVLHNALRARLVSDAGLAVLVPANAILDRNSLPAPDPAIVMGEHEFVAGDDLGRNVQEVVSTLHVWKKEPSLAGVRAIAGAIRMAIKTAKLRFADAGFSCADCYVAGTRVLRDPDGQTSHAVVTIRSIVAEVG